MINQSIIQQLPSQFHSMDSVSDLAIFYQPVNHFSADEAVPEYCVMALTGFYKTVVLSHSKNMETMCSAIKMTPIIQANNILFKLPS